MPEIYQTPDMEGAIRSMVARNYYVVVLRRYQSYRKIPLRQNAIADLPACICRPHDSFAPVTVENWKLDGGLMIYHWHRSKDLLPKTEALMLIEAPYQYREFEALCEHASREVVIYRPPTWSIHEAGVETIYPTSSIHRTLYLTIDGFVGRDLNREHQVALTLSGFPPERSAVFEEREIEAVTGIHGRQLHLILKGQGKSRYLVRYDRYVPQVSPDEQDDRFIYDRLEAQTDEMRGERFLRYGKPKGFWPNKDPAGWDMYMKKLLRMGCVSRAPSIYVFQTGVVRPDYIKIDALANARRGDWFKMRNFVDDSQEYPI